MQIDNLLCTIHKFVKVVYEKTAYEYTIFISENLLINIKLIYLNKLKNKPIQMVRIICGAGIALCRLG